MSVIIKRKGIPIFLVVLFLLAMVPGALSANASEPPGLIILVSRPPEDLTLSLVFPGAESSQEIQLTKKVKAWEAYYRYFYHMSPQNEDTLEGASLILRREGRETTLKLPEKTFETYNNLLTLEVKEGRFLEGQKPYRTPLLIGLRVIATLVLEGLVFLAFGYRQKSSWRLFLIVNLITQGGLNLLFTGPLLSAYWMIGYYLVESIIFLFEMAVFGLLMREGSRKRAVLYAFVANLFSLLAGGILLAYLPV